jgi:hypothetical protein
MPHVYRRPFDYGRRWRPWVGTTSGGGPGPITNYKTIEGALTSAGTLIRQVRVIHSGALTFVGGVIRKTSTQAAGALTSTGSLVRSTKKQLAGTLSFAGVVLFPLTATLAGLLTLAGTLSIIYRPLLVLDITRRRRQHRITVTDEDDVPVGKIT